MAISLQIGLKSEYEFMAKEQLSWLLVLLLNHFGGAFTNM
jgi:hypothetical protein